MIQTFIQFVVAILFTGSDEYGFVEVRHAGELTEQGFECEQMQQRVGKSGVTFSCI